MNTATPIHRARFAGLLATAAACLLAAPAMAGTRTVSQREAADPAGTVEVINVAGTIDVSGWDQAAVDVSGTIGANVERVEITHSGSVTTVRVVLPNDGGHHGSWNLGTGDGSEGARLKIRVPQKSALDASLVSSDLHVAGLSGNHHLQTVSGDITGDVGGTLQASTVSGDVHLAAPNARTAQVETVSGDIFITGAVGDVSIHTVSGNAALTLGALNRARFEAVSGDLEATMALAPEGQLDAASVSGDVHLVFAGAPDADLDIQTFSGDIDNCFGPKPVTETYGPGTRLSFRNGKGGGRVHVDTQSGDVTVCTKK